jgi:hypothetical protein
VDQGLNNLTSLKSEVFSFLISGFDPDPEPDQDPLTRGTEQDPDPFIIT